MSENHSPEQPNYGGYVQQPPASIQGPDLSAPHMPQQQVPQGSYSTQQQPNPYQQAPAYSNAPQGGYQAGVTNGGIPPQYAQQYGGIQAPQGAPRPRVGIGQAIKNWGKYMFHFSGRASRSEFWWIMLLWIVVGVILDGILGVQIAHSAPYLSQASADYQSGAISYSEYDAIYSEHTAGWLGAFGAVALVALVQFVTTLGLHWRRLHDAGFSGLFCLFSLFSLGVVPFIMSLLPSKSEGVRFDTQADVNRP